MNMQPTEDPIATQPLLQEKHYQVAQCQELGRYLIAGKNLSKGSIIFQEYPIVVAPQKNSTEIICPGCFRVPNIKCPRCNWPLCGLDCPGLERHEGECEILKQKTQKKDLSEEDWIPLQDTLMIFRCIQLKLKDNQQWISLKKMEPLWNQWSKSPLHEDALQIVKQIRKEYDITEDKCSTDEILQVLAILDINSYEVKMPEVNIQGCYKLASLAEHSCIPNAFKTTSSDSLLLTMRAVKDIPKGMHISTSYADILWTTSQRQRYIQWSKFFICNCLRCEDSTEMGSFISAFLCPNCPISDSNLVAITPILTKSTIIKEDEEEEPLWKDTYKDYQCNRCKAIFPANRCESYMLLAEKELQELDKDCSQENNDNTDNFEAWLDQWTVQPAAKNSLIFSSNGESSLSNYGINDTKVSSNNGTDLAQKRRHYKKFSSTSLVYLHPQHSLVLDACHTIFLLYSAESSCMDELLRKSSLGMHLLKATSNLFAGISLFRGTIMYELAITKTTILTMYLDLEPSDMSPGENIKALAKEIIFLLSESIDHLRYESEDQAEGKLFALGVNQLGEFQKFIKEIIPDL